MKLIRFAIRPALAGFLAICSLGAPLTARAADVTTLDDIDYWVGSGSNEAALVLQWNDGGSPVSLAWGFRWEGSSATVETMFSSVAGWLSLDSSAPIATGGDSRLSLDLTVDETYGNYINGISYDQNGLPGYDQTVRTQTGYNSETGAYWAFFISAASQAWPAAGHMSYSDFGISSTLLANDTWYGFTYDSTDGVGGYDFATPEAAAIPEPSAWMLAGAAILILTLRLRHGSRATLLGLHRS